jgi:hypothetical protein
MARAFIKKPDLCRRSATGSSKSLTYPASAFSGLIKFADLCGPGVRGLIKNHDL